MEKTILAHATACAPAESCGWVVNTSAGDQYFPCQNFSAEPTMYFRKRLATAACESGYGIVSLELHLI